MSIATDPDGGVYLGSLVELRRLEPQPNGSHVIATVQTRAYGQQENISWSVTDALTDIAPLQDGRVLVLTRSNLSCSAPTGATTGASGYATGRC